VEDKAEREVQEKQKLGGELPYQPCSQNLTGWHQLLLKARIQVPESFPVCQESQIRRQEHTRIRWELILAQAHQQAPSAAALQVTGQPCHTVPRDALRNLRDRP